jgi:hypothetical protein
MTPKLTTAALTLTALAIGVAGCNRAGPQANAQTVALTSAPSYCTPFPATKASAANAAPLDPGAAFEDCLHRWSYTLASARDPADVVAQAAVDACAASLSRWNQQALEQPSQGQDEAAPSITTGRPTDQISAHAEYAQSRALFYVVQARAANCARPPASELAEAAPPSAQSAAASPTYPALAQGAPAQPGYQ